MAIDFHGVRLPTELVTPEWGIFEAEEMGLAASTFIPGDRVLVAGTGMGWLQAWVAQLVGPENVWGIEAQQELAWLVPQNVAVNDVPLRVQWGALTPTGEPARFTVDRECWATSTATDDRRPVLSDDRREKIFTPGVRLANHLHGNDIHAVALDIEGAEYEVLTPEVLSLLDKAVIEMHLLPNRTDPYIEELFERLHGAGLNRTECFLRDRDECFMTAWLR